MIRIIGMIRMMIGITHTTSPTQNMRPITTTSMVIEVAGRSGIVTHEGIMIGMDRIMMVADVRVVAAVIVDNPVHMMNIDMRMENEKEKVVVAVGVASAAVADCYYYFFLLVLHSHIYV